MIRTLLAAWAAAILVAGCGDSLDQPLRDGYTLAGVVLHAQTGVPLGDVDVLIGWETSIEFRPLTRTDAAGKFTFRATLPTGPSREVFRFEKPGFVSREVLARTATRVGDYRYSLEVRLEPDPTP